MRTETCNECGGAATVSRRDFPFQEMGVNVELQNIEVIQCSECGIVEPIIPNIEGLMSAVALAVVCSPEKLSGKEVRFLRKFVGKSATEFSKFLHVDATHLSKIENDRTEIGARLDKLVRLLVATMSPELNAKIKDLLEMLPDINDQIVEGTRELQVDPATMNCHYAYA